MSKRLLIRLGAVLAVVALIVASTLGQQPIVAAAVAFGALACGISVSSRARASPAQCELDEHRRRRAHERSQSYLSRFNAAPVWPDPGGKAQSHLGKSFVKFKIGRCVDVDKAEKELKRIDISYRARDQPYGLLRTLIGTFDPAVSVP